MRSGDDSDATLENDMSDRQAADPDAIPSHGDDSEIEELAEAVWRIVSEGDSSGGFVIVTEPKHHYYVQAHAHGPATVYLEAASNAVAPRAHRWLTPDYEATLHATNWNSPDASTKNFHRLEPVQDRTDGLRCAQLMMAALRVVSDASPLRMDLNTMQPNPRQLQEGSGGTASDDRIRLSREANAAINDALAAGEVVRVVVEGVNADEGIVGTDERVLVRTTRSGLRSWPLTELTGAEANFGFMFCWVALRGPSIPTSKLGPLAIQDVDWAIWPRSDQRTKAAVATLQALIRDGRTLVDAEVQPAETVREGSREPGEGHLGVAAPESPMGDERGLSDTEKQPTDANRRPAEPVNRTGGQEEPEGEVNVIDVRPEVASDGHPESTLNSNDGVAPTLRDVLDSPGMAWIADHAELGIGIGRANDGSGVGADLTQSAVVVIAGPDGSGKSVCINTIVCSLLMDNPPTKLKLVLFDPTGVELTQYRGIPHLMTDVIVEPTYVENALRWLAHTKAARLSEFASVGVRDIRGYRDRQGAESMPYIVFVGDEMETALDDEIAVLIAEVAIGGELAGIHFVLATQIPIAERLADLLSHEWRTIIAFGALPNDRLLRRPPDEWRWPGPGSMLYHSPGKKRSIRVTGAVVSEAEVSSIANHWRSQGEPNYDPAITHPMPISEPEPEEPDPLFYEAVGVVRRSDKASASLFQRRLRIGHARAARILDQMEDRGIVGPADGTRFREVLVVPDSAPEYAGAGTADDWIGERILAEHPDLDPRISSLHPRVRLLGSVPTPKGAVLECEVTNRESVVWSGFEVTGVLYRLADGATIAQTRRRFNEMLYPGSVTRVSIDVDARGQSQLSGESVGFLITITRVRVDGRWA